MVVLDTFVDRVGGGPYACVAMLENNFGRLCCTVVDKRGLCFLLLFIDGLDSDEQSSRKRAT